MPMMPSASDSSVLRTCRLPLVLALTLAGLLLPASPLLADGWPLPEKIIISAIPAA